MEIEKTHSHFPSSNSDGIDGLALLQSQLSQQKLKSDREVQLQSLWVLWHDQTSAIEDSLLPLRSSTTDRKRASALAELVALLLPFLKTLDLLDRKLPLYRMKSRLQRATESNLSSLKTAAAVLLIPPSSSKVSVKKALVEISAHEQGHNWWDWMPYLLEQLGNTLSPPGSVRFLPTVTLSEWRIAERTLGCVLFPDDVFEEFREILESAPSQTGTVLTTSPVCPEGMTKFRVRELVRFCDPRVIDWMDESFSLDSVFENPEELVKDWTGHSAPEDLARVWLAALLLGIVLREWEIWMQSLAEEGDAEPRTVLLWDLLAREAIRVLAFYRPNFYPFREEPTAEILASLPQLPKGWLTEFPDSLKDASSSERSVPLKASILQELPWEWQENDSFWTEYIAERTGSSERGERLRAQAETVERRLWEQFLRAGSQGREPSELGKESDRNQAILNQREQDFLQALLELSAVDSDQRRSTSEIGQRAFGPGADVNSLKSMVSGLNRKGFVKSSPGCSGGIWLTPEGVARANKSLKQ